MPHPHQVDLKYINNSQVLEVLYEGRKRRFSVISVHPRTLSPDIKGRTGDLAHDLNSLSISAPTQLWSITWDTAVVITKDTVVEEVLSHKASYELNHPRRFI
jgi:AAA family ATPase